MSKYSISLTEREARVIIKLLESPALRKTLTDKDLEALLRITNKLERQSNWDTF